MSIRSHPESEWLVRRPLIEELYQDRHFTMDQVRHHLCSTGFHVNKRMVKNRLLKWNLHKKLSLLEVRTAVELLGPDLSIWSSNFPRFRVRRKVITFEEILRSFQRRGIRDPFDWAQNTPLYGRLSPNVEIWSPATVENSEPERSEQVYTSEADEPLDTQHSPLNETHVNDISAIHSDAPMTLLLAGTNDLALGRLRDPEVYVLGAQAIPQLRVFCMGYAEAPERFAHREPAVHQFTSHARLQNHMNEGLYHFAGGSINNAFANFKLGFLLLEEILEDVHPMAIALYLLLLCTLMTKKADVIARMLLKQTLALAATRECVPFSLVNALRAICRSDELLELPLLCLRAASECMTGDDESRWKVFYVKERYCDALYHAHLTGEGTIRRIELFKAQESFYGPSARNVLVTSLNIADDHLIQCRFGEAESRFRRILQQSENLSGFHRAKIHVVTLSGLARTAIARANQWCEQHRLRRLDDHSNESPLQALRHAAALVGDALQLAEIWFEGSARRVRGLYQLHADVAAMTLRLERQLNLAHAMYASLPSRVPSVR